eukprot:scaffold10051_cov33-Tisochrysis_lutea.AAC.1
MLLIPCAQQEFECDLHATARRFPLLWGGSSSIPRQIRASLQRPREARRHVSPRLPPTSLMLRQSVAAQAASPTPYNHCARVS